MVCELRKFGEALIIVSQFPTDISMNILRNAGTRIFHRIRDETNQRQVQGALNLDEDQARYLHYLKPGEAIMSAPGCSQAFPVYVCPDRLVFKDMSDDELAEAMRERFYSSYIEIWERPLPSSVKLKVQLKLHQLLKGGAVDIQRIRESTSTFDFKSEVLPVLQELIDKGYIRREICQKTGRILYRRSLTAPA
jgi:hypothetical protein